MTGFRLAGWAILIACCLFLLFNPVSKSLAHAHPAVWYMAGYIAWRLLTAPFWIRPILSRAISSFLARPSDVGLDLSHCVYSLTLGELKLFVNSAFLPIGGRLSGGPREGAFEFFYGFRSEYGYGFPLNLAEARAVRLLYHKLKRYQIREKRQAEMVCVQKLMDERSTEWTQEDDTRMREYLKRKGNSK